MKAFTRFGCLHTVPIKFPHRDERTRMKRTVRLSSSVGGRYVPMSVLIVSMYIITPRYLHRVSLCLFTVALWGRQLTEQAGGAGQGLEGNGKVGEEDQLFDRMPPCVKIS